MCCSYACRAWAWCAVIRRRQCPHARTAASCGGLLAQPGDGVGQLGLELLLPAGLALLRGRTCSPGPRPRRASHVASRAGHFGSFAVAPGRRPARDGRCAARPAARRTRPVRPAPGPVGRAPFRRAGVGVAVPGRDGGRPPRPAPAGQPQRGRPAAAASDSAVSAADASSAPTRSRTASQRLRRSPATRSGCPAAGTLRRGRAGRAVAATAGQELADQVEPGVAVHDPGHRLLHRLVGARRQRRADQRPAAAELLHAGLGLQRGDDQLDLLRRGRPEDRPLWSVSSTGSASRWAPDLNAPRELAARRPGGRAAARTSASRAVAVPGAAFADDDLAEAERLHRPLRPPSSWSRRRRAASTASRSARPARR